MNSRFNIKNKINKGEKISIVIAIVYLFYGISASTSEKYLYICTFMLCLWFGVTLLLGNRVYIKFITKRKYICFIVYIYYISILSLIGGGVAVMIKQVGSAFVFFSPMFIIDYYYSKGDIKDLKKIIIAILLSLNYYSILSLNFYIKNKNAARAIASNKDVYGAVSIGGGYVLAFGLVVMIVYLFDLLLKNKIKKPSLKLACIADIILFCIVIFKTSSTITVIALVLGIVFNILLNVKKGNNKTKASIFNVIIFMFLTSFIILCLSNAEVIGEKMVKTFNSNDNYISIRLREVGYTLMEGDVQDEGTMGLRFELIEKSIKSFTKSPFIGNALSYKFDYELSRDYVGNHSQFFDIFAMFGLFGAIPYILIIYFSIKEQRRIMKSEYGKAYIFVILFMSIFNPINAITLMVVFLLFIPSVCIVFENRNELKLGEV